jgi:hypothetical protein
MSAVVVAKRHMLGIHTSADLTGVKASSRLCMHRACICSNGWQPISLVVGMLHKGYPVEGLRVKPTKVAFDWEGFNRKAILRRQSRTRPFTV